jgi:iron complex outermembrane receptor protein/outer membrane receptor for ferrienterochelin and colicins
MRYLFSILLFLFSLHSNAQHTFSCIVKDSTTHESLPGVSVVLDATANATATDANGKATLNNIPDGTHLFHFSFLGYKSKTVASTFPLAEDIKLNEIDLAPENENLEEVIVSSSRTNSRIEDLNMKVEVLGQEDMDEESTLVPGGIGSILGDLSIITIQRTNPFNGNDAVRMQGLDPRYTQLMRDGLPLYGGFSGSLGVLSIPPLDLKQVEIIKGSVSTLYGGGAIGGLINFISKEPTDSTHTTLTLNATSLKEFNLNAFTAGKKEKLGWTIFGGGTLKTPVDINGDGFAEVPQDRNVLLHPRIFYTFNPRTKLIVGLTSSYDHRMSGDIKAIRSQPDSIRRFLQQDNLWRNTVDLQLTNTLTEKHTLTFKSAASAFQRALNYSGFRFDGTQYSTYSELNDFIQLKKNNLVIGGNFISETFVKNSGDSTSFHNYDYNTTGVFIQDEFQATEKLSLQAGLRADHHNTYGNFFLPRISVFYKASAHLSVRLGWGTGYKVPNLFDFSDPSNRLMDVTPTVKPEHSYGMNTDVNYHTLLFDKLSIQVNEALYFTHINNPLMVDPSSNQVHILNAYYVINSYGTDTYVRLSYADVELYLGYNHTESLQEAQHQAMNMPFNPKDKFSTTLAYNIEGKWRTGIEASWMGNQYDYSYERVPGFWFLAAMVERKFKKVSFVLNCENLLDTRQSKFEPLVYGAISNPVFKSIWGPLEGRVVNFSVKITL